MIHSTPEFPPEKDKGYSWPDTARDYGQSFLCITFDFKMLNNIGKQLMYNFPQFYEKFNTDFYTKNNPYLNDALLGKTPKASPWQSEILLTSSGGTKFTSFAKYANFGKDLYDAWVAPTFKSELFSETWQNGQGKLSSYCSGNFHVLNVQKIKLPEGIVFKETVDNAKWAISQGKTTWVCIGDINRQTAQEKRAGGTACFDNSVVWRAFNEAVDAVENCPKVPGLWVSE